MEIEDLRVKVFERKIKWTAHVAQRIQERDISRLDVINCISSGEIIESYPEDYPNPSCLILGLRNDGKSIHVVAGSDGDYIFIITAYYPNLNKFEADYKTRRKS
ncbi:DUF4258 domain-containing protein [Eubacteriaceae bacterium ES3]|nr:DUF4258 domain-containing protein [Eubacteriaceae bacterium ES3]